MPLEVNGYSATFKAFADFAEQSVRDGAGKTIADARVKRTLDGRKIVDLTKAVGDSVHKWTRGVEQYVVNDRTRKLFKNAVIDMFGGESKIPASVKKARMASPGWRNWPICSG